MYCYLTGTENSQSAINVLICDNRKIYYRAEGISIKTENPIRIAVNVDKDNLRFQYSEDGQEWASIGGTLPAGNLSDDYIEKNGLVFTGAFVGICCQDLENQTVFADFKSFILAEE